jgi:hypothetical protein
MTYPELHHDASVQLSPAQPDVEDGWNSTDVPDEGQIVRIRAQDRRGFYGLPFAVEFRDDDWFNAATGEPLDCYVAGWKHEREIG